MLRKLLLIAAASVAFAVPVFADPPAPAADTGLTFPAVVVPQPPTPPAPQPDPAAVPKLLATQRYVIEGTAKFEVRAFPHKLVKITKLAGPVTIIGDLIGYPDGADGHVFKGPFVVVVQPLPGAAGQVTLDIRPPAAADEAADVEKVLDLGGVTPAPPGPGPAPTDQLLSDAQAAFTTAPDAAAAKLLAAIYRSAAATGGTVDDATLTTTGGLLTDLAAAGKVVAPLPKLEAVRKVFAKELGTALGTSPTTPLTPDLRAKVKTEFNRIADVLEALK